MKNFTNESASYQEAQAQPVTYAVDGLGKVVTGANILVAIILVAAMYYDSHSATVAVLSGVAYFSLSTTMALLTLSGSLTHIVTNGQREKTIRLRDKNLYSLQAAQLQVSLVPPVQIPRMEPARPPALPQAPNFVAAHAEPDDGTRREAAAWLLQLYGADGSPDPKKVLMKSEKERPGRVRIAAPSAPAKQLLLDRYILHDLGNGFRLNLGKCPTITAAQSQLSYTPVVGRPPTHPHPQLHEYESGGA